MRSLLQFTLDLFSDAPAPQPVAAKPPAKRLQKPRAVKPAPELLIKPEFTENIPNVIVIRSYDAINNIVYAPPESISHVMRPVAFAHPHANREAHLEGSVVGYHFKRGKRRTIGFVVGADGLAVSAPRWVPLYELDKAVQEKSAWIVKKLHEQRERRYLLESNRIVWRDGTLVPFMGEQVIVVVDPRHAFASSKDGAAQLVTDEAAQTASLPGVPHLTLHIGLPHDAAPERIRDAVQAWLMRQAKRIFEERLNLYAPQLGVQWRKMSLSSAGTRWGSATSDGSIRLNWRLIHLSMRTIDYVVVHELSHLRVMDHSPRFWSTVESIMPDYAALRGQLKSNSLADW
jgi:predicted metal-dependent hydrolase